VVAFVSKHFGWDEAKVWDELTFAQLLLYCEQMQMQQRAEAGIREIVAGYVGHEDIETTEDLPTLAEVTGGFDAGPVKAMPIEDLPDDVRSVLLAEQHRLKTGKTVKTEVFKTRDA
jgi:hypothetical protein